MGRKLEGGIWKGDRGSLTLEAGLTLSFFILLFYSWSLFLHFFQLQAKSQHALDQVCLELSAKIRYLEAVGDRVDALTSYLTEGEFSGREGGDFSGINYDFSLIKGGMDLFLEAGPFEEGAMTALFYSYIDEGSAALSGKGEKGGRGQSYQKIRWTCNLDRERGLLELTVTYRIDLPFIFRALGPLELEQRAASGLWSLPGQAFHIGDTGEEGRDEEGGTGIWQQAPFSRGRYFADRIRRTGGGRAIRKGKGFDIYSEPGCLVQVISLNPFSKSYAVGGGEDPEGYRLKAGPVKKQLEKEVKKMLKNSQSGHTLSLEDGTLIRPDSTMSLRLLVILPEEAGCFSSDMDGIADRIRTGYGVDIQWMYLEKAFVTEKEAGGELVGS